MHNTIQELDKYKEAEQSESRTDGNTPPSGQIDDSQFDALLSAANLRQFKGIFFEFKDINPVTIFISYFRRPNHQRRFFGCQFTRNHSKAPPKLWYPSPDGSQSSPRSC